jgi:predicted AAA+ superfamily ATPase
VLNAILENFTFSPDRIGLLFEHLVCQLLISSAHALNVPIRLSSYRTSNGVEVDFILEKKQKIYAIKVKASKTIGQHDLKGLKNFSDFVGKTCQKMVIYLSHQILEREGILILPLEEALNELGF